MSILILGKSIATSAQMKEYILKQNENFNTDIVDEMIRAAELEGVRADVVVAQSCLETGNFTFKGDVKEGQNNFAGIGATGNGASGNVFPSIFVGALAQVQHLKIYATKEPLTQECVDPRATNWFKLTKGGTSPYVETLGGSWAVPGYSTKKYGSLSEAMDAQDTYGHHIIKIMNNFLREDGIPDNQEEQEHTNISYFKIIAQKVNVKKEPLKNSPIIDTLYKGDTVYSVKNINQYFGELVSGGWITMSKKYVLEVDKPIQNIKKIKVQVASLINRDRANDVLNRALSAGFVNASIEVVINTFKVYLDVVETEEEANCIRNEALTKGFPSVYIKK